MPRKARIDAPGALHHVITRGIERRIIFTDNADCDDFLERLEIIVSETNTSCYAWSLVRNHFHLLLKTGGVPIATVMRRLLTGYAMRFNRRHERTGQLFQNRYKSILCQEDVYFKELIRYIHLNPLRAGIVADMKELASYPYSGHSAIMGKKDRGWQSVDYVLSLFDTRESKARPAYEKYLEAGIDKGRRWDLIGGGLVRSAGGWAAVSSLGKERIFFKSDERILGDGDFVADVLAEAEEAMERKTALAVQGVDLQRVIGLVADLMSMPRERIIGSGKSPDKVKARRLICYWGTTELGLTMTGVANALKISVPTASIAARRGEQIAIERGYSLM
ncbi:MAG: transposase, partial [Desulfatiglandales bacterium]